MKIASWNVNGIRAAATKWTLLAYLDRENPDTICLQEVKAEEHENPLTLDFLARGYEYTLWNAATSKKGYSGTAILTKEKPKSVQYELTPAEFRGEGRVIISEFSAYTLVNVYTPNSKRDLSRLEYRQAWDAYFASMLHDLYTQGREVVVCGDLNVAYAPIDLSNPESNHHTHGFTDEERAGFERYMQDGFIDTYRHFYPDVPDKYSWWSNFARSRERNIGWRIDYTLVSKNLQSSLTAAYIHHEVLGSDHCPVGIVLH